MLTVSATSHAFDEEVEHQVMSDAENQVHDVGVFESTVLRLAKAGFSEKAALTTALVQLRDPGSRRVLLALLESQLHVDNQTGRILIVNDSKEGLQYTDAITGNALDGPDFDSKRILTNNPLRKKLRGDIARFDLTNDDEDVRRAAVVQLRRDIDQDIAAIFREHQSVEKNDDVIDEIQTALAIFDLQSEDPDVRIRALEILDGEVANDVFNAVKQLLNSEEDKEVRRAAESAIQTIESKRRFYGALETFFFGLSFGSVLVLAAIGLAITFGVMGVINMAHGELIMLGAYTTFVMQQLLPNHIGLSIVLSIPAAFVVSGLVGIAIERGVVRFLYGRPLETLLATFGISLILQQLVRTIFSPLNRSVQTPEMMSGLLRFNDIFAITYNRLYILIFTLVVFAGLWLILNKTSLGLRVRAVSQNRQMARAMGVRTARVDAMTFGLGSGVAGIAGVALSQLTNVGPNLGQAYIIDSFMVVVFGGVGNLWGTLVGGMILGVATKFMEPHVGAVMAKILMLVFIILFIQRRKQGLFPQKGRAASGA
ncbi:MAG: urea ABC transporter permease subunit UrtB [Alcanivoracaceae bacterium]